MILGFSGTRKGMTPAQRAALPSVLAALPERVLHGGAVGSDTEFDEWIAPIIANSQTAFIEIYPATDERRVYWGNHDRGFPGCRGIIVKAVACSDHFESRPWPPLERNRIIAERCDALLACPSEPTEQLRSGTWATVRYARKAGKPVTFVMPSGEVVEERR